MPDMNQVSAICRCFEESQMNITLMKQRADIISVLMAAQVCVWKLISVAWEIHEMRLRYLSNPLFICRKVHNEMRWMVSKDTMDSIQTNNDFMTQTYNNSLRIAQVCAEDLMKYIHTTREDLFTTYCSTSAPSTKLVYEELQKKWVEKSEEQELMEAFSELTKQTGYKSA